MNRHAHIALLLCLTACSPETSTPVLTHEANTQSAISIENFEHVSPSAARITFSDINTTQATWTSESGLVRTLTPESGSYTLPFFEDGSDGDGILDEHTYTLSFPRHDQSTINIQFVRQSAAELAEAFSFDKPTGYTILSFNNISFINSDIQSKIELPSDYGHRIHLVPRKDTPFGLPKLDLAAQITGTIYSHPMKFGPSKAGAFKTLKDRFKALENGEDAAQCRDVRNLFLHASHHYGLNVRLIGLYNYGPRFQDLISYSHAIAEVETSLGWIAIDPWNNMTFKVDGKFASVKDLRQAFKTNIKSVEFVQLNQNLYKVSVDNNEQHTKSLVVMPNKAFYSRYFGTLEFTEVTFF